MNAVTHFYSCTFSVLYAKTVIHLKGYAPGLVEYPRAGNLLVNDALVEFPLTNNDLGYLGLIRLRKHDDKITGLSIEPTGQPTDEDVMDYYERFNPNAAAEVQKLAQRVPDELGAKVRALVAFGFVAQDKVNYRGGNTWDVSVKNLWGKSNKANSKLSQIAKELRAKRDDTLSLVVSAYFDRLNHDRIPNPQPQPPVRTLDLKPKRQKVLDEACIEWAARGKLPDYNMKEFLDELQEKTGEYFGEQEFKRALQDAGSRDLIQKKNGRWKPKT